ncbi:hypothetical protein CC86DRAFT_372431 [Ophiobolus disseminans]|uniref:XPA C-terminal domain-containing protein n=1 Tax=Ophiobolus disseminans TaxID=1469910 RepID=A0A6A6ZQZ2_9PLEO|nr:hypothetical protein CC86DRAFT_372431 [Ophiobolus disseminans]
MSSRRSGRAKAPVKYTSDSEGSDFGEKKGKRGATKATPKKRTKAEQEPAAEAPKKRTKKDPETLAAEHKEKAEIQEAKAEKASHKKAWDAWLEMSDASGALLDEEPSKDVSITQTDANKKYGVKKEDLIALKHFEKRNPVYNNTIKLYLEEDVRKLGFRKYGILAGVNDDEDAVKMGEEMWAEEHKDDPEEEEKPETPAKAEKKTKAPKAKTPKQKWTAYIDSHAFSGDNLSEEPEKGINQSDSKTKYGLQPKELAVLAYFPKPNPKYNNTTKLFKEDQVQELAWRKAAWVGGVDEEDEEKLLAKGQELYEAEKEDEDMEG